MFKKIALYSFFALFLGLLPACSPTGSLRLGDIISLPGGRDEVKDKTSNQVGIGSPVALPPSFAGVAIPPPVAGSGAYMPNGLPVLKPMGVNVESLFAENIRDADKRFDRVEMAVVDFRKEFESFKPSIVRLAAVETDIQDLIRELEVLLQETPASSQADLLINNDVIKPVAELKVSQLSSEPDEPVDLRPPPEVIDSDVITDSSDSGIDIPPDPPPRAAGDASVYSGVIAKNLRVGEHADKLRIVLDTNKYTNFTVDLDNDEELIVIELPDARWVGDLSKDFNSSDLLESYSVEDMGDGSMIILSLKRSTQIIQRRRLSPDSNPNHRIYFDLKK